MTILLISTLIPMAYMHGLNARSVKHTVSDELGTLSFVSGKRGWVDACGVEDRQNIVGTLTLHEPSVLWKIHISQEWICKSAFTKKECGNVLIDGKIIPPADIDRIDMIYLAKGTHIVEYHDCNALCLYGEVTCHGYIAKAENPYDSVTLEGKFEAYTQPDVGRQKNN